jgi:hypothetical protein
MPDDLPSSAADVPGPPHIRFPQAFGFSVDEETATAAIRQTIDAAQQATGALHSKINEALLHDVVQPAVFADSLKAKVANALGAAVQQSQEALNTLQHPIFSGLVNDLGTTIEATQHLGVTVPQEGQEAACPDCVVIRSAALSGDLGPALECYRATALPLRDARGMEYAARVDWIRRCLPPDDNLHDVFAYSILNLQNEPIGFDPYSSGAAAGASRDFVNDPTFGQGTAVVGAPPAGSLPPGIGPPPSGPSGVIAGPAPAPGGPPALPGPPRPSPPTGQPGIGAPPVPTAPTGPTRPPPGDSVGVLPLCSQLAGMTLEQAMALWPPGSIINDRKIGYYPDPITGAMFIWVTLAPGAPGGIGAPPYTCQVGQSPPVPPGYIPPLPPATPPIVAGPAPVKPPGSTFKPETPVKPPTQTQPTCIPICKPEAEKCDYTLWCSSDHILYITKGDENPHSGFDRAIQKGDPAGFDIAGAVNSCLIPRPQPVPSRPSSDPQFPGEQQQQGCNDLFRFQVLTNQVPTDYFRSLFSKAMEAAGPAAPLDPDWINSLLTGIRNGLGEAGGIVLDSLLHFAANSSLLNCSGSPNEAGIMLSRIVLGLIGKYVADVGQSTDTSLRYAQNTLCPYLIPTISEAANAWSGNTIDETRLRCIVEANGGRWDSYQQVIDASRAKLQAFQIGTLRLREKIGQADYERRIRELGFTRPADSVDIQDLLQQIPPASDLVRFMVRDAGDDNLARRFRLDQDFDAKFAGRIPEWAKHQGVDTDYMRYIWRAHWSIPAPGQLANMLHRLSRFPAGDERFVDVATIKAAMEQQDIAPFWIEKFIAISYSPLTRIDARRAFEIGALSKDRLKESYLDLGYNDSNADVLVNFNVKNVQRSFLRRSEVQKYAAGELDDTDFETAMTQWGADDAAIQAARTRADILRRAATRKACIKAYRSRFMLGEFDAQRAIELVQSRGQNLDHATVIVEGWKCEAESRGKEFTFGQLNQLYEAGLIDEMDYVTRAKRLHYDQDEAVTLLRLIQRKLRIKATTLQQKQIVADKKAEEKLTAALLKQANADERKRERAAAALAKARTVGEMRQKRLLAAGAKFSEHSEMELPESILAIRSVYQAALNNFPVTNDQVIAALTVITGDREIVTLPDVVEALATALTAQAS